MSGDRRRERARRRAIWIARLGNPFLRLLFRTWSCRVEGREQVEEIGGRKQGVIFPFFHSDILMLACTHKYQGIQVMVSEHADGEIIAQVVRRFGFTAIRGSTTRRGLKALMEMARIPIDLPLAITPDGPRGPDRSFQEGAILLAERTGRVLIPTGAAGSRLWRARSWDRFRIPKPFARVQVVHGEGILLPGDLSREDRAAWASKVREAMLEAERRAWKLLGVSPPEDYHELLGWSDA